ncbi:MAG: hypothetical protein P4L55_06385 [Syntrophobacteraceae bacterium]|nr:hypothetical protein [Syntrophobacteraceae bacterium]
MEAFRKEILVSGAPRKVDCVEIDGQIYSISKGLTRVVSLEEDEEWYRDVRDPDATIAALRKGPPRTDIFTFWQRFPDTQPHFGFYYELEPIAALPITSFDQWWKSQISPKHRNKIRKAEKQGLRVVEANFDDDFVRGMTDIFNETPVRQGRRFWHYGKDFDTVKRQFSRRLYREHLIGAYLGNELVGFMMLADAGPFMYVGQILSKIKHRDKAPNNALIGKAVELCERRKVPYMVYAYWGAGPFADFKRQSGFERMLVPRYYVPLNEWGKLVLRLGLHRGLKGALPEPLREKLKALRKTWLESRAIRGEA